MFIGRSLSSWKCSEILVNCSFSVAIFLNILSSLWLPVALRLISGRLWIFQLNFFLDLWGNWYFLILGDTAKKLLFVLLATNAAYYILLCIFGDFYRKVFSVCFHTDLILLCVIFLFNCFLNGSRILIIILRTCMSLAFEWCIIIYVLLNICHKDPPLFASLSTSN